MPERPGVSYNTRPRADGRWQGYYTLANGKRKTVIRATEAAMRAAVNAFADQVQAGRDPVTDDPRTDTYLDFWIGQRRDGVIGKTPLAPATVLRYEQLVRLQIAPHIGHIRRSKLRAHHIDQMLFDLKQAGVSGTVRLQVFRLLHVALKHAERREMIARNPCDLVDPPSRDAVQPRELDTAAVVAVLKAARGHEQEAMLWAAIGAGLRQGELFALQWPNVNLDLATVRVREKVQWLSGIGQHRSKPKTAAGVRTMTLPAIVVAALRKHQDRQRKSGKANPLDLVFPSAAGTHFQASNWNKNVWASWKRKAGIDPTTPFRALTRKAHHSLLVALNVDPETLRHRAGHTSASTTMDYYVQTVNASDVEAAKRLDRGLRRLMSGRP